jgi:hypothetical protein
MLVEEFRLVTHDKKPRLLTDMIFAYADMYDNRGGRVNCEEG